MAKLLLVEDDNNLREIYGARLMTEGFEIVSAADGEEALALAVKEKPDLIISDIMMPKISGFDMLDILRTTPETKDTKVIMMTALSQPEDRARGESLGANKYLVKSQVTLEDVVTAVHEVLGDDKSEKPLAEPTVVNPVATATNDAVQPVNKPVENAQTTVTAPKESPEVPAPTITEPPAVASQKTDGVPATPQPPVPERPTETPMKSTEANATDNLLEPASKRKKVIEPITKPEAEPDIMKLAREEEERERQLTPSAKINTAPNIQSNISEATTKEKKEVEEQIKNFVESPKTSEDPPIVEPTPEPSTSSAPKVEGAPATPSAPEVEKPVETPAPTVPEAPTSPTPPSSETSGQSTTPIEEPPAVNPPTEQSTSPPPPATPPAPSVDPNTPNPNDIAS